MAGERIGARDKKALKGIISAAKADRLALMRCKDKATGMFVSVLCAVIIDGNDESKQYEMIPLAKLFVGDAYQQLIPPS